LVNSRDDLENYVKEQLFLVCAIVLKRCVIEESKNEKSNDELNSNTMNTEQNEPLLSCIINSVLSVILSPLDCDMSQLSSNMSHSSSLSKPNSLIKKLNAASFVIAILNEYASSTRSSDVGLPWIKHLHAKKKFESTYLKNIFLSVLEGLNNVTQNCSSNISLLASSQPLILLITRELLILETILSWNFDLITVISSQYAKHVDSFENNFLRPTLDWKDVLVNEKVIQFFFFLHTLVRNLNHEQLIHHSLQCLSQLSSLTGSVISNQKYRLDFINYFLNVALQLVVFIPDITPVEAVPFSSLIYKICLHLQNRSTIQHISKEIIHNFIQMKTQLICKFFVAFLNADQGKDLQNESNADKYKLAIDNLCDAWVILLQAIKLYEKSSDEAIFDIEFEGRDCISHDIVDQSVITQCIREIFQCYLRCHLATPEGLRQSQSFSESKDLCEEIQDFQEDDSSVYCEQLTAIGSLGRLDAKHSIHCLTEMLRIRISQFEHILQTMISNNINDTSLQKEWTDINEDIHWLLLISAWTLTQVNFGEKDMMPSPLIQLSINAGANIEKTSHALRNLIIDNGEEIDPIVRIFIIVLKLCAIV